MTDEQQMHSESPQAEQAAPALDFAPMTTPESPVVVDPAAPVNMLASNTGEHGSSAVPLPASAAVLDDATVEQGLARLDPLTVRPRISSRVLCVVFALMMAAMAAGVWWLGVCTEDGQAYDDMVWSHLAERLPDWLDPVVGVFTVSLVVQIISAVLAVGAVIVAIVRKRWWLLGQSAVIAFTNAAATAILALILIFIFEIFFNVSTNMALMVLCDYNHPLLERMKREAPGTFFHSLMVATLVEDAARAIGANPLKAKAGALFHDIGKLAMPQYFTENNLDSANQHLDLNPQMSSIIIRDHVKEGLALARQYRMCRTVRDAIGQHHGNDLVKFFYNKALEEQKKSPNSAPVLESQFRYDGIPPQDKEMAIISLADACEAACRSLDKPSASKIEAVVDQIFRGRFEGRQLNNANITLAELEKVRQSFINTLVSMKHGRIAYHQERKRDHSELRMANAPSAPPAEK